MRNNNLLPLAAVAVGVTFLAKKKNRDSQISGLSLSQLQDRVYGLSSSGGTVKYYIIFRGKEYYCESHFTDCYDAIRFDDESTISIKQAYQALYDDGKRYNDL